MLLYPFFLLLFLFISLSTFCNSSLSNMNLGSYLFSPTAAVAVSLLKPRRGDDASELFFALRLEETGDFLVLCVCMVV